MKVHSVYYEVRTEFLYIRVKFIIIAMDKIQNFYTFSLL
jgi:hypothetical protein